ncbi:Protein kinase-like domain [Pseudocohnilembus persalinus]|uniref:Protein kinase-like domain n=1 Tax=Pseudocohnilembus persalinus TaxID=266149 RepID=A0A0V0QCJ3_PSEPJ|nr:Protein kinase-like domain [Pseudocohnilembus persalinus]|eukprot:KRW99964.1 Protein kinase-like domain [Pseudocohnilembus persalinus]
MSVTDNINGTQKLGEEQKKKLKKLLQKKNLKQLAPNIYLIKNQHKVLKISKHICLNLCGLDFSSSSTQEEEEEEDDEEIECIQENKQNENLQDKQNKQKENQNLNQQTSISEYAKETEINQKQYIYNNNNLSSNFLTKTSSCSGKIQKIHGNYQQIHQQIYTNKVIMENQNQQQQNKNISFAKTEKGSLIKNDTNLGQIKQKQNEILIKSQNELSEQSSDEEDENSEHIHGEKCLLLEKEFQIMKQLNTQHKSLIKYYKFYKNIEVNGQICCALEMNFYEGGDYFQNFIEKKQDTVEYVKHMKSGMKSLLEVLNLMHQQGIAHNDIKPENILVTQDPQMPILIDLEYAEFSQSENLYERQKDTWDMRDLRYSSPDIFIFQKQLKQLEEDQGMNPYSENRSNAEQLIRHPFITQIICFVNEEGETQIFEINNLNQHDYSVILTNLEKVESLKTNQKPLIQEIINQYIMEENLNSQTLKNQNNFSYNQGQNIPLKNINNVDDIENKYVLKEHLKYKNLSCKDILDNKNIQKQFLSHQLIQYIYAKKEIEDEKENTDITQSQNQDNKNEKKSDNSNSSSYQGKTAGLVTGKSQHSAFDFFEKIETNFLEKYLLYLIKDELGQIFLNLNEIINNPNLVYLFNVQKEFKMSELMEFFQKKIGQYEQQAPIMLPPSSRQSRKKEHVFIQIYQNKFARLDIEVQKNEFLFAFSKFKQTHSKLKDFGKEILKRLAKEKQLITFIQQKQNQEKIQQSSQQVAQQQQSINSNSSYKNKLPCMNLLIFYTGDVNFKFQNDEFLTKNMINIHGQDFNFKVNIFYVSKVQLFQYFCKSNNLNIEQIDDKTITLFELRRMSLKRRNLALENHKKQKQQQLQQQQQQQSKNSMKSLQSNTKKQNDKEIPNFSQNNSQIVRGGQKGGSYKAPQNKQNNQIQTQKSFNLTQSCHQVDDAQQKNFKNRSFTQIKDFCSTNNKILKIGGIICFSVGVTYIFGKYVLKDNPKTQEQIKNN